jgi:hypothetical protein
MCEHTFVRWDNLTIEAQEGTALPGYREPAVVRHFDAPEALDTRFYEVRAKSALNRVPERSRMPFRWTINAYRGCSHACLYCFARPTHTYLDFNAGRDFEKEIVVKVNVPEVLRVELARPSWKGEHIAMGTNTDPYQWVEGRYKLMRGIWEALRDAANPCSVLTKSPLLLRDLDLMKEIAKVTDISANLSVPTIDEKAWRASEPHTPNPAGAARGRRRAQPGGDPDGDPGSAAHAGDQRRPRPGAGDPAGGGRRGGDRGQRHRAAPARGGPRSLHGLAALLSAGSRRALRGALCTRRVPATRRAGADRGTRAKSAGGDQGAVDRRLPARAGSRLRGHAAAESGHEWATASA